MGSRHFPCALALGLAGAWVIGCGGGDSRSRPAGGGSPPASPTTVAAISDLAVGETTGAAIATALRSGELDALEQRLAAVVALEADDPANGEPVAARAFGPLATADPELTARLRAWQEENEESPYAALALASHYNALAWQARGHRYAKDTSATGAADFERWRDEALPLVRAAVDGEPRLVEGWVLLVNLSLGDPQRCLTYTQQGLQGVPASWRLRAALMNCLRPRWGGSYEAMTSVAREARGHEVRNPRLRWLAGYAAQDRADLADSGDDLDDARRWIDQAVTEGGRAPIIVRTEVAVLIGERRLSDALAALADGLAEWPDDRRLLAARTRVLSRLGREAEARSTLERLAAIDPDDEDVRDWQRYFGREARKGCESLARGKLVEAAIARCREAMQTDPNDEASRYWLGKAYVDGGRYAEATSELEAVLLANPRHRNAIIYLDWLYGRDGDWQRVAALWDAYIALEPEDARAWLERAGTRRRLGRSREACQDLERSCELGNEEACRYRERDC